MRIVLLLFLTLFLHQTAQAQLTCEGLLSFFLPVKVHRFQIHKSHAFIGELAARIETERADNDYIFLRKKSELPHDPQFLVNHRAAVLTVFAPWFSNYNERLQESDSFKDLLSVYHEVACLGPNGRSPYKTADRYMTSARASPGILVSHESDKTAERLVLKNRKQMEKTVAKIRRIRSITTAYELKEFLRHIAVYVWLGSQWRIFKYVNNSVLMAQANWILIAYGFKPIPQSHKGVDYWQIARAQGKTFDNFFEDFTDGFFRENPEYYFGDG